ncbi:thiol reductant ABC exporter subunit CydC [Dentiradicibacter hellwigii]|uniref:Thiol reductant ABC exporter subunit CydC n=1 Tax=Dentiradicibacter hellwigii TaxID=3149053 RepID=A0ABV4UD03_9RHOO
MTRRFSETASVLRPVLGALFAGVWRRMALGASLAAITVLAGMGLLGLSGWFIAATAIAGLHAASALAFDVFAPSAGIRLLALGRTAARYGERLVTHDATLAALAALRERIFRGWASAAQIRELLRRPARALFRLTSDLDALESLYLRLLTPAGAALCATAFAAATLGLMTFWLGIALGIWMLAVGIAVSVGLFFRSRRPALRRALLTERLRAQTVDLVSGQTELVMAGRLAAQCAALEQTDRRLARADRRLHRLDTAAGAIYGIAGSLTLAATLLGVGALVDRGQIGIPAAVLALLIALAAMEPFAALRRGALEAGRMWLAAKRLSPHCAEYAECADSGATPDAAVPDVPNAGDAVILQRVSVRYPGSATDALQSLSLTIAHGERVAVVGPSGAGKSTLMALLAGELAAHAGSIQRLPFAWLSQRADLFQDSLRENLLLAAPEAGDEALWHALESAGLAADIRGLNAGLETRLGESGLGLSAGQRRRLALARLLLQSHPLWLLDEPTEGLDAATAADVLARLRILGEGRAWLMATHLRREAALADRLLILRDGRVEAEYRWGSRDFAAALAALRHD